MRKQHHEEAEETINLRLWKHAEAVRAVPYLRSIVRSLREHWLEWQRMSLQVKRLDSRPGRPDRQALILRTEADREVEVAAEYFSAALGELNALDVYCLDPVKGLAQFPFHRDEGAAWIVFDLFAPLGLDGWRFHADPLETRRLFTDKLVPGPEDRAIDSKRWFWQRRPTGQTTNLE